MSDTHTAPSDVTALPQTTLALEARHTMESVLPPKLYVHSIRTFLYGRAWAWKQGRAFDEEGLFVACMFHDAGFYAPYRDTRRAFQLNSSRALGALLHERGVEDDRIERLRAAIRHHMQPVPRWRYGVEAGLLQIGAYMDIMALRAWKIPAERRAIRRAYPLASSLALIGAAIGSIRGLRSCLGIMMPKLFDDQPALLTSSRPRDDN